VFQVCKVVHETAAKDPLLVFDAFGRQLASQEPLHPPSFDLAEAFPEECTYCSLGNLAHQLQCPLSLPTGAAVRVHWARYQQV
jgi:hypothetical protein